MNLYRFSGKDSGADSGRWSLIVKADSKDQAKKIAQQVLNRKGRSDLILGESEQLLMALTHGVLVSDVDPRTPSGQESQMSVTFPVQYPQDMPLESARECFRIAFQDHSLDSERKAFALHGYAIFGYGLKVSIGEPTAMMSASQAVELPEACSDQEAQSMLMSLSTEQDEGKFAALPINWLALAMWVIKMLRKKE